MVPPIWRIKLYRSLSFSLLPSHSFFLSSWFTKNYNSFVHYAWIPNVWVCTAFSYNQDRNFQTNYFTRICPLSFLFLAITAVFYAAFEATLSDALLQRHCTTNSCLCSLNCLLILMIKCIHSKYLTLFLHTCKIQGQSSTKFERYVRKIYIFVRENV